MLGKQAKAVVWSTSKASHTDAPSSFPLWISCFWPVPESLVPSFSLSGYCCSRRVERPIVPLCPNHRSSHRHLDQRLGEPWVWQAAIHT